MVSKDRRCSSSTFDSVIRKHHDTSTAAIFTRSTSTDYGHRFGCRHLVFTVALQMAVTMKLSMKRSTLNRICQRTIYRAIDLNTVKLWLSTQVRHNVNFLKKTVGVVAKRRLPKLRLPVAICLAANAGISNDLRTGLIYVLKSLQAKSMLPTKKQKRQMYPKSCR